MYNVHVRMYNYMYVPVSPFVFAVAADVFRLNEQPENAKKKLDVCASFFEIYLGKVRIEWCMLYIYSSLNDTQSFTVVVKLQCTCVHVHCIYYD